MRVLAALSGGVDSAVAAARAVAAGHEVTGVHLALQTDPKQFRDGARGCCSLDDARDARRAADVLNIPFYVFDMAEEFQRDVINDFLVEYESGRTPNPCLRCNERVKFAGLLNRAMSMGFDAVCTGHYARLQTGTSGVSLHRAADPAKDQSYVLGVLEQWQLEKAMFPVGDTHKPEIRAEADRLGLLVANKPDSHDICFISNGDTADFLSSRIPVAAGNVIDVESGEVLGQHKGAALYTVGQRHGLAIGRPAADGQPRYVVRTSTKTNEVFVGGVRHLSVSKLSGDHQTWTSKPVAAGTEVGLQWRAHGIEIPAVITEVSDSKISIQTSEPIRGVAAGQQAVLYQSDQVVGSFIIAETDK